MSTSVLTSLVHVPTALGYGALFLLVGAESAGIPLPGETAIVAAGVLAAHGRLSLPAVIGLAATAAVVGDNLGYLIGREGVRRLLTRSGRWELRRARLLELGEVFFTRHGGKAVFLGRWVTGVRIVVAWLAGAHRMRWPRFAVWNALGGVAWASSVALLAYLIGSASSSLIVGFGFAGLAFALIGGVAYLLVRRLSRRSHRAHGG